MLASHFLKELASVIETFGGAADDNQIHPPQSSTEVAAKLAVIGHLVDEQLAEFYSLCDGVTLADVHNGYFIHPLDLVLRHHQQMEPNRLILENGHEVSILNIGSTGGGDLFVREAECGEILILFSDFVINGPFDMRTSMARTLGADLDAFLDRFLEDARAFRDETPDHSFLDRWVVL